jgi:hypothetical protein
MTDPLRPFANIIRTLWRSRTQANGTPTAANQAATSAASMPPGAAARARTPGRTLQSHLKARIAACSGANSTRLRETFVETVLLWELGDELAPDPGFGEMVSHVSEQLATDPAVAARLDQLLARLAAQPPA